MVRCDFPAAEVAVFVADRYFAEVLAYVTNRAIMKRLDDVCGKAGWRNEYRDSPHLAIACFTALLYSPFDIFRAEWL
ncbi:hypothetical protein HXZ47_22880, partial [Escherichia coli]|nr:hypothetical protein [Escherichia coli]